MSSSNRAAVLTKAHRVLKKHYKPVAPPSDRTLLEHLLYACCLENGKQEHADEAFALLEQRYFDWNEVRVTTIAELGEVMSMLPDAPEAAKRLKRVLHHVFESYYLFDIDFLKKQNLGKAVKEIEKLNGVTPFVLAYFTQNALGGHAIPVNASGLQVLYAIGAISEKDVAKDQAPGLERAIAKNKGVEFGSLLHQLATDLAASPFSNRVRGVLTEIAADAKDRLPKRAAAKPAKAETKSSKTQPKKKTAGKAKTSKAAASKTTKKVAKKPTKAASKAAKKPAKKAKPAKNAKKSASKRLAKKKPR